MKMKKEVGRMLLPDAPEVFKKKKAPSPPRKPCVLTPGTPTTPPPKIRQKWEQSGPSTSSNPVSEQTMDIEKMDVVLFEDIVPETPHNKKISTDLTPMVTPNDPFMPCGSSPMQVESVVICEPSTSDNSATVPIFDNDFELAFNNPGSDIEVDVDANEDVVGNTRIRITALESSSVLPDNLNPNVSSALLEIERQDDMYLREMSDVDKLTFDWNQDANTFQGVKEVFSAIAGPTFSVDKMSALQILEKIWDYQTMTRIVEQTNIYAQQMLRKNTKASSRLKDWKDINIADLWVFFAVLILQSLDTRAVESEYWYSSIPELEMPAFKKIMPYKKFILIKRCLHFVNNDSISNAGKFAKIQPIIDHLNQKFAELYLPGQEIALDESLLLWKGKLGFVQKITNKAAGVGVKTYELCESKTGYLWTFRVYTGKQSSNTRPEAASNSAEDGNEPDGKVSALVFDLMKPLLNKGHDIFYNSPLLSRLLKMKNTDTMGTLRVNREFVPSSIKKLTKKDLRVGEMAYSHTYDLSVVLWRDSNLVALISTYHKIEIGGKEKYGTYKYKPNIVLDYNNSMGGVDKKDQLLSAFPMERGRNQVWYKKVFRRLLNVSICNAWIILKYKQSQMSHRKFREMLVRNILLKYQGPTNQVVINRPLGVRPQLVGGHYLEKGPSARARCKWCADRGRDSRTIRRCDVCKVPLCAEPCFKNYHTV